MMSSTIDLSNDNTNMALTASTAATAAAVTTAPSVVISSSELETSSVTSNHSQSQSTITAANNAASRSAAGKRTLLTHTKDGKLLSEKKLRRLEKNRLSARECRRRKREATETLEKEIFGLEGENLRLRLQLQIGEEAEESMRREQDKVTEDIDALLKRGASEAEIYATIEDFKEKFADYGRDRRSAINFHLMNIERLLMPTQTTTLAMRALQGGSQVIIDAAKVDSNAATSATMATTSTISTQPLADPTFVAQSSNNGSSVSAPEPPNADLEPKALFEYLVKYLEVTPEQAAALKDSRFVAQEMDGILIKALAVLEELRTRLAQCGEDLETEFNNIRSILTPTQAAKFLIWVANNSACMHMLNELWSRVYPQTLEQEGSDGDSP